MTRSWTGSDGGVDWHLALDRDDLLPGRLVPGLLRLTARDATQARGIVVTLRGEERWKYEVTTSNGKTTTTTVHTGREDLPPLPVRVSGGLSLAAGETLELPFDLPAPPLGPPTVEGDKAAVEWTVEAKLDREGGLDASIEVPVRVHQPTALLRAGVVRVAQFALFDEAAGHGDDDLSGTIELDPVPLVAGSPFAGRVVVRAASPAKVRSIRAELKVHVKVTVGGGLEETITAWQEELATETILDGEQVFELGGVLAPGTQPSVVLPHSIVTARFELILDRRLAPDRRLARDVAIATTAEL
jgi:hypothetical protein